jgi:hypothetical protein
MCVHELKWFVDYAGRSLSIGMKKTLLLLLLLIVPSISHAMVTPLFGPMDIGVTLNSTRFYSFGIGSVLLTQTTYVAAMTSYPTAGTISGFKATISAAPGNAASSTTFTLMKNGVDTAISCVIADTATTCTDGDTVTTSPGDTIALKSVATANNAVASMYVGAVFTGTTAGESFITGGTGGTLNTGATTYFYPYGQIATTTAAQASTTMPTAGVIDNLYATTSAAIGTAASGKSYDITLYKNGVATSLTCKILEIQTGCSDTNAGHAVTYEAGDSLYLEYVPTATPTAVRGGWGLRFKPTIDGESLVFQRLVSFSNALRYEPINGIGERESIEANAQVGAPVAFDLKKLYFTNIYAPPTGIQARSATARKNSASTGSPGNLSANVTASNLFASDLTNVATYAAGDLIDWLMNVTSTPPTTAYYSLSAVIYINPAAAATVPHSRTLFNNSYSIFNNVRVIFY